MAEKREDLLPIFDGEDWAKWKFRLLLVLESKGVKNVIDKSMPQEEGKDKEQWMKNDVKKRSIIVQEVSNSQLELIINETKAADMINKLNSIYEPSSTALKFLTKRKLLSFKMQQNDDPKQFITMFEQYINDLRNAGETLTEDDRLNCLLLALPEKFSHVIDKVDALPEKQSTVEYVKSKLLVDFKKNSPQKNKEHNSHAFNTHSRNRSMQPIKNEGERNK